MSLFGQDIGIDLGTASVLIYLKGKGVILQEPSVVAVDKDSGKLLSVGAEAQRMLGRTPGNIIAVRPLRDGVISDYEITEKMIRYFLKKVCGFMLFRPRVVICVPSGVTEVEERAVIDAAVHAGARKAYLIEEPVAAAIGADIDISKPNGNLVVDIGGGTTDIAVISLGGVVVSNSIKVAGDKFDEAIIKHLRKKHNILIGERTAEQIKIAIGCVTPRDVTISMEAKGRCLITGLPKMITVDSNDILEALEEPAAAVIEAVLAVLEHTPPELVGDISTNGIVMTGGGSLVWGMNRLISQKTGIRAEVAPDPVSCVAVGTGRSLDNIQVAAEGLASASRKRIVLK